MTTAYTIKRSLGGIAILGLTMSLGSASAGGQARTSESPAAMGHAMPSDMEGCPMMAAMAQGPEGILKRRAEIRLTPAQVNDLETLAARSKAARSEAMSGMHVVHARLDSLGRGDRFDESAVRTTFDRMGAMHSQMGVALLRAQHDARTLLTPEQREKLAAGPQGRQGLMGMDGMMGMHGMMGKGMKMDMSKMDMSKMDMSKMDMSKMDMSDCPLMQTPASAGERTRGSTGSSRSKASTPAPRKTTAPPRDSAAPMDHHGHKPPTA